MTSDDLGEYIQVTYSNFWDIECKECNQGIKVYGKAYYVENTDPTNPEYRCKDCQRNKKVAKAL